MVVADQRTIDSLTADLRETIAPERVVSGGLHYDRVLKVWNGAVESRPAVVVTCLSVEEVQTTVRTARQHQVPLSVRGGGHDAAGRSLLDGGLTLDLTEMRDVVVDPADRHANVAGGATSTEVVRAAEQFGLSAVTGTSGSVGMVGLTVGGGYGPLIGRFGLAADNLLQAEVVLASGEVVTADAQTNPELFWALRGGGGNFGVVTRVRIRLHELGPLVTGAIMYPLNQTQPVLERLDEVLTHDLDELTVNTGFAAGPGGDPVLVLTPTWAGDPDLGSAEDGPVIALGRLGTPVLMRIGVSTHAETLASFDRSFPGGAPASVRTRSFATLTPPIIAALEAAGNRLPTPLSALLLTHFHGAAARVPARATAFAHRAPHLMSQIIGSWTDYDISKQAIAWADQASASLGAHAVPGGYPVHLRPIDHDQVNQAYRHNTRRLLAAKATFDPDSVFTAHPLPVPGQTAS